MTTPFRGLYRTTAWAYVTNNTMAFNVPEAEYRAFGYEPDYDSLPWKVSYVAAKAGKAAQAEQTNRCRRPCSFQSLDKMRVVAAVTPQPRSLSLKAGHLSWGSLRP